VRCEHPVHGQFDLPDRPTYGQLEDYDTDLQASLAKRAEQTDLQYAGAIVHAAAVAGLIGDWQPAANSGVPLTNLRGQDGPAVVWASGEIRAYIRRIKSPDPKAWLPSSGMPAMSATSAASE
jgi:hypothetical protein